MTRLVVIGFFAMAAVGQTAVRIVFAGDVMLDNGPGHVVAHGGDPFADVAAALKDGDFTVANLECAIVSAGEMAYKNYVFRGPKSALPLLHKYFSAVSLANNHTLDYGRKGLASELPLLKMADLPYFGGGANLEEARQPLLLKKDGKRIALLGYNGFNAKRYAAGAGRPGVAPLYEKLMTEDIRKARVNADFVLLFLHWGEELEPRPEKWQQAMARRLIDAGADAVIGGHPHVTQTIEWHKGKPIVYSLGNFVFDYWPTDPPLWTGWLARLTLGSEGVGLETYAVELDPAGVPHPAKQGAGWIKR